MSLDMAALQALAGAAQVSLEDARAHLDETGASAEDLETSSLRPLWAVLEGRIRDRVPLDVIGIRHALKGHPEAQAAALDVLDGAVMGVARERPTLLRDAGVRRRVVEALRVVAIATKSGRPIAEIDALLRDIPGQLAGVGSRVRSCSGDSIAMLDHLERAWSGQAAPRLTTGLGDLDEALGGLVENLIVLGARPGVGKSAVVAGMVKSWAERGVKVGVLCYEDDARDMQARIIAARAGCQLRHVRGDLLPSTAQRHAIGDALAWWAEHEDLVHVDDSRPSGTAADVLASMRTMVERGCRVVILDNMTCVRLDAHQDRHLAIEHALRDIRSEAQHLRVPAIVVGHLKRGVSDEEESQKAPRLSDFSASGAWENYARVMMGMWRGEHGPMLRVLKQTNGPAGQDFALDWIPEAALVTGARLMERQPEATTEPRTYSRRGA